MTPEVPWWKEPTRAQWMTFLAAWLGWILDAFDFMIFLVVMPEIAKEFGQSMTNTAGVIALTLLLRLAGGYFAGSMADRWGRKLPLMISIVGFAVCDGLIAFAPSFFMIMVLRAIFGLFMGAEWTSGATLAMENWPERSRGIASGVLQGSWAIGHMLAGIVQAQVVPTWGWRAAFIVAALPVLLVLPIRFWVPESEEWTKSREKAGPKKKVVLDPIIGSGVVGRIVWGSLLMACGFGMYYGISGLYAVLVKTELGLDAHALERLLILFNVGMMVGAITWGTVAARKGVATALLIASVLFVPSLFLYVGKVPGMLELGAFLGGAFGAGISGVTPLLLTSLFPANLRARCVGIVYHAGAFPAAFVPMGTAALSEHAGMSLSGSILLVAGSSAAGLMFALLFRPRRGTVEESAAVGQASPALH